MGMEIIGSEGILSLQGGSAGDVMHYPYPALHPAQTERVWQPLEVTLGEDLHSGNQRAIIDLIEAIEGDRAPISSAADAVAALEMILGAYEAQISGGRVYMPMVQRRHPLEVWLEQK
jgi:predicted dehydrogenase